MYHDVCRGSPLRPTPRMRGSNREALSGRQDAAPPQGLWAQLSRPPFASESDSAGSPPWDVCCSLSHLHRIYADLRLTFRIGRLTRERMYGTLVLSGQVVRRAYERRAAVGLNLQVTCSFVRSSTARQTARAGGITGSSRSFNLSHGGVGWGGFAFPRRWRHRAAWCRDAGKTEDSGGWKW